MRDGTLEVSVDDDGAGGADAHGRGLRGLADRVEALGGRLSVESPHASGTRLRAEIPSAQARRGAVNRPAIRR
jgi:signal transduction histidine kinase